MQNYYLPIWFKQRGKKTTVQYAPISNKYYITLQLLEIQITTLKPEL